MNIDLHQLLMVFAAYVIAAGNPGPSNMRIMGVAMARGRAAALMLASGVVSGSIFWGLMASTGISALFARYAQALILLQTFGGLYLLFLAYKAGRSALTSNETLAARAPDDEVALSPAALPAGPPDASGQPKNLCSPGSRSSRWGSDRIPPGKILP